MVHIEASIHHVPACTRHPIIGKSKPHHIFLSTYTMVYLTILFDNVWKYVPSIYGTVDLWPNRLDGPVMNRNLLLSETHLSLLIATFTLSELCHRINLSFRRGIASRESALGRSERRDRAKGQLR